MPDTDDQHSEALAEGVSAVLARWPQGGCVALVSCLTTEFQQFEQLVKLAKQALDHDTAVTRNPCYSALTRLTILGVVEERPVVDPRGSGSRKEYRVSPAHEEMFRLCCNQEIERRVSSCDALQNYIR